MVVKEVYAWGKDIFNIFFKSFPDLFDIILLGNDSEALNEVDGLLEGHHIFLRDLMIFKRIYGIYQKLI